MSLLENFQPIIDKVLLNDQVTEVLDQATEKVGPTIEQVFVKTQDLLETPQAQQVTKFMKEHPLLISVTGMALLYATAGWMAKNVDRKFNGVLVDAAKENFRWYRPLMSRHYITALYEKHPVVATAGWTAWGALKGLELYSKIKS